MMTLRISLITLRVSKIGVFLLAGLMSFSWSSVSYAASPSPVAVSQPLACISGTSYSTYNRRPGYAPTTETSYQVAGPGTIGYTVTDTASQTFGVDLGPPGGGRVFVTAADDIEGITTSQGLAQRLTLLDDAGKLREGPFSVSAFDTPSEGLGVPVFRSNPGFVQGGLTGGGAREFDLPNLLYGDLGNVAQWIVP